MKKQKILLIGLIIAFVLLLAGATYAYIRKTRVQGEDNQLSTLTCLDFDFTNADVNNTKISIENAYPIPDAEGLEETPYTFTVTNKCNTPIVVDIGMQTTNNGLNSNYVKYGIDDGTNTPGVFIVGTRPTKTVKVGNNEVTINVLDKVYIDANTAEDQDTSTIVIDNDTPSKGARKTYNLRLWVDEATTWEQGNSKTYTGKIVLAASPTKGRYTPEFSAESGTLLAAIKTGDYKFLNPLTAPGKEINSYSESLIAPTEDDYGTSYYFRGNVQNNYVVFANKCWKIVRIAGNNAIKLFYWGNVTDNKCGEADKTNRSPIISNTLTYTKDAGGEGLVYQTASGVGFMYGKPDSTTLYTTNNTGAQDNISKSTILEYLEDWYEANLKTNYSTYLADVIWCGDKSIVEDDGYGEGHGYGQLNDEKSSFGSMKRISPIDGISYANPSLICPDAGLDSNPTISKYTVEMNNTTKGNGNLDYPIGLITADEVAYAGGANGIENDKYYLYANTWTWTMSPTIFSGPNAGTWRIHSTGRMGGYNVSGANGGVFPSIALIPSVTISSGNGTVLNPYVINGIEA